VLTVKTIDLESWSEFPKTISRIRADYGSHSVQVNDTESINRSNTILFRGHADAEWKLRTTLERTTAEAYSVERYFQLADSCVNEIESFTGRNWMLKTFPEIRAEIKERQDFMRVHLPYYEYLVYLRHHGFPSPLLDWSSSPYIAAYFAFEPSVNAGRCAVFAFIETPLGHKSGRGPDCKIHTMGPHVTTHSRHFAQKASYTIATAWSTETNKHTFCSHHDVSSHGGQQDVLIRVTMPQSDRTQALMELDDLNINHYTLFQTEDALIRTMALRAMTGRS
jgi:hypothetical protein